VLAVPVEDQMNGVLTSHEHGLCLHVKANDNEFLVGGSFTITVAYLVTMLNWFQHVGTDLAA
jgi:glutathione S-transferase